MKFKILSFLFFLFLIMVSGCDNQQATKISTTVSLDSDCIYEDRIFNDIEKEFDLEPSDYTLTEAECDFDKEDFDPHYRRGRSMKAKGVMFDGESFELYYRWGWCSPGGTDCTSTICFSSEQGKTSPYFSIVEGAHCGLTIEKLGPETGERCKQNIQTNNCYNII